MATTGKKGGSKMIWIIGGLILIAGGIGAYFLLRKPKEEEEDDGNPKDEDKKPKDEDKKPSDSGSGNTNNYVAPKSFTFPFKTESEGNTFRAWVISKDPTYAKSIDLSATGKLNSFVEKAWLKYGAEYLKKPVDAPKTEGSNANLTKDIDTIIKYSTGIKAEKTYLSKTNSDFVSTWAKAVRNKKRAFLWENQFYRTKTGDKILEYNPIGNVYYASKSGSLSKYNPNNDSKAGTITKGNKLGKASAVDFDGKYVFVYFPERSYAKWLYESAITSTKPSSNFSGMTDEIEFSNFDHNLDLNL